MRRAAIEAGTWESVYVPVERARDHVAALQSAGYGHRLIAHIAGVDETTVSRIGSGYYSRVMIDTEERICAVPLQSLWTLWRTVDYIHRMPSGPVVRRLRALAADGWTYEEVGEPLNWSRSQVWKYVSRPPKWTLSSTTRMIDEVYRSPRFLVPVREAPRPIADKAWPRPFDWDDIDDPADSKNARSRSTRRLATG